MSYGIKYRGGFTSPLRDKLRYEVYIMERGYTGEERELPLTGDRVVITQGAVGDDELKPFKPSTATLTIICREDDNPYISLYSLDPLRYKVLISECRNVNGAEMCIVRWTGFISTGLYSQPNARAPYKVEIECNDGLEILKNTTYAQPDGTRFKDTLTVRELFDRLLEPLGQSLELWDYFPIDIDQKENTFDLVTLSSDAIYGVASMSDGELPSYYDVFESILVNFGLQAFQRYESWCVRSIASLASHVRPYWVENSISDAGKVVPLYDDSGKEGVSTDAEITMLPPLRRVNISAAARTDIEIAPYDPEKWTTLKVLPPLPVALTRGTRGIRMKQEFATLPERIYLYPALLLLHAFPGCTSPAEDVVMNFTATLHNLNKFDINVRVALMAVDITKPLDALFNVAEMDENKIKALGNVAAWNIPESRWEKISTAVYSETSSLFERISEEITIEKSDKQVGWRQRVSLPTLSSAQVSIETTGYPSIGAAEMRIVLAVLPARNGNAWFLHPIELSDADISITSSSSIAAEEKPLHINVSNWGADDVEMRENYVSGIADAAGRGIFAPILARKDNGKAVRAFINPSLQTTATEAMAARLRAMRNDIAFEITGNVYKSSSIDMNTVWRSRDNRYFYANSITWHLREGLYEMCLRELLPMRSISLKTLEHAPWATSFCALDNGIVCQPQRGEGVYHVAPISAEERLILDTSYATHIVPGYKCACVIETIDATAKLYNLYAYDDSGRLLSRVDDIYAVITAPEDSSAAEAMAKNARYDAATATWVVVGHMTSSATELKISQLDSGGGIIQEATAATAGRVHDSVPIIIFNGGFAVNIAKTSGYDVYWHSYALHKDLQLQLFSQGSSYMLSVNDTLIARQWSSGVTISHRTADTLATDAWQYELPSSYSFVAMNNALVLGKNLAGNALVYDVRTGAEIPVQSMNTLGARYALVGDVVYVQGYVGASSLIGVRIVEGAGYFALIDVDGNVLYDADGARLMAKKFDY